MTPRRIKEPKVLLYDNEGALIGSYTILEINQYRCDCIKENFSLEGYSISTKDSKYVFNKEGRLLRDKGEDNNPLILVDVQLSYILLRGDYEYPDIEDYL